MTRVRAAVHVHSEWSFDSVIDPPRPRARLPAAWVPGRAHRREHCQSLEHPRPGRPTGTLCRQPSDADFLVVPGLEYRDADNVVHVPTWGELPTSATGSTSVGCSARWRREGASPARTSGPTRRAPALRGGLDERTCPASRSEPQVRRMATWPCGAGRWPRASGLPGVASLDFHRRRQFHPLATVLDIEGPLRPGSVHAALRAGRFHAEFMPAPVASWTVGGEPSRWGRWTRCVPPLCAPCAGQLTLARRPRRRPPPSARSGSPRCRCGARGREPCPHRRRKAGSSTRDRIASRSCGRSRWVGRRDPEAQRRYGRAGSTAIGHHHRQAVTHFRTARCPLAHDSWGTRRRRRPGRTAPRADVAGRRGQPWRRARARSRGTRTRDDRSRPDHVEDDGEVLELTERPDGVADPLGADQPTDVQQPDGEPAPGAVDGRRDRLDGRLADRDVAPEPEPSEASSTYGAIPTTAPACS